MKSTSSILFSVFISIATISFAQDNTNIPTIDRINFFQITSLSSGWHLRIKKDGSAIVTFGSSDGGIAPAKSLSFEDAYNLLVPNLLNKSKESYKSSSVTFIGNNQLQESYCVNNLEVIKKLYEKAYEKIVSSDMNRVKEIKLEHPFVIEDAASKK